MAISQELLVKAAKVYEAAESVEGMKPKQVFESHKKCAPGEFGMNKEGGEKQAVVGTTLGALGGAVGGKPGKKMRAVGRGALKGLGTDVGAILGGGTGALLGLPLFSPLLGGIAGAGLGGYLGNSAASSMLGPYESDDEKMQQQMERLIALQKKMRETDSPQKAAAFEFGRQLGKSI